MPDESCELWIGHISLALITATLLDGEQSTKSSTSCFIETHVTQCVMWRPFHFDKSSTDWLWLTAYLKRLKLAWESSAKVFSESCSAYFRLWPVVLFCRPSNYSAPSVTIFLVYFVCFGIRNWNKGITLCTKWYKRDSRCIFVCLCVCGDIYDWQEEAL